MIELIHAFVNDPRTQLIFYLAFIDLATGLIAAIRTRTFQVSRIGDWYFTNVLPFFLGHFLIFTIGTLRVAPLLDRVGLTSFVEELIVTVGVGPAVVALISSIRENLLEVRK